MTSDIAGRIWTHKTDAVDGFTKRYGVHRLVYVESHESMEAVITREKQMSDLHSSYTGDNLIVFYSNFNSIKLVRHIVG